METKLWLTTHRNVTCLHRLSTWFTLQVNCGIFQLQSFRMNNMWLPELIRSVLCSDISTLMTKIRAFVTNYNLFLFYSSGIWTFATICWSIFVHGNKVFSNQTVQSIYSKKRNQTVVCASLAFHGHWQEAIIFQTQVAILFFFFFFTTIRILRGVTRWAYFHV